jgi:hypothetical protein
MKSANLQCVAILNQDSFYRELTEEEKKNVHGIFSPRLAIFTLAFR